MNIKQAIGQVVQHLNLDHDEMVLVMKQIMTGEATQAQIGAFLMGLRMKTESIDEITGATRAMRELASKVTIEGDHLVDIVGTGGDGANLFNVSTASAFVVAAAGAQVAKHGNYGVSSSTGSADLLQAAGVNIELNPEQVARCVREIGIGFMFAPMHHTAMKHAIGPRKELGIRTIMNILGPMTNPAGVPNQVIGVFAREFCRSMAEVSNRLGSNHVLVVHSLDGLDEISIASETCVAELKDGQVTEYTIDPEALGVKSGNLTGLSVEDSAGSLALIRDALGKREGKFADKAASMIALNAGAAIYAANVAATLGQGVEMARDVILTGEALEKLQALARFSQACRET